MAFFRDDDEHAAPHGSSASAFLARSLFIYDETACQSELDPPEDMILYFYPHNVRLQLQLFLLGGCSSMKNFCDMFSTGAMPSIICLERHKMALRRVGTATMVLTGMLSEPDSALEDTLDVLYEAFVFYHGPFEHVMNRAGGDFQAFRAAMHAGGDDLVPLLRAYDRAAMKAFNPLPHAVLPVGASRFFVRAAQLLSGLSSEADNHGGVVIHRNAVLCTSFDSLLTRFVLGRYLRLMEERAAGGGSGGGGGGDYLELLLPVFCYDDVLEALRDDDRRASAVPTETVSEAYEAYAQPDPLGEYIGLYLLAPQGDTALAVLTSLPAVFSEQHIKALRHSTLNSVYALDEGLSRVRGFGDAGAGGNGEAGTSGSAGGAGRGGDDDGDYVDDGDDSAMISRGGSERSNGGSGGGGGGGGAGSGGGGLDSDWSSLFFAVDTETKESAGFDKTRASGEAEREFVTATTAAHVLLNDAGASQVVLSNHIGCLYASQTFSREMHFFQPRLASPESQVARIQATARATLKEEHGLSLP